jgi:CubicO group peptidase (beta-lactamase class C family)
MLFEASARADDKLPAETVGFTVFAPRTGTLCSNFAFDVLSAALSHAAGKPYDALLKERVLDPAGLQDTVLALRAGDQGRLLQGHNFDGKPLPDVHLANPIEKDLRFASRKVWALVIQIQAGRTSC